MKNFLELLKKLKELRPSVPMYVLFDGITALTWIGVEKKLIKVEKTPESEIDIILNSSGGSADEAYKMIRAFREKYSTVNVIIPFWAKSAATLFALGASKIVLHARGELGPIDAQIKKDDEKTIEGEKSSALTVQSSIAQIEKRSREGMLEMFTRLRKPEEEDEESEIVKIGRAKLAEMLLEYSAKFYIPLLSKIDPTEMGEMARILDIGQMYARRILKQYNGDTPEKQTEDLLHFLVYECPDHGYVVDYHILKSFLPFVSRTDEEPFGKEYDKVIAEISMYFMEQEWPKINNFFPFPSVSESGNIKTNETNNEEPKPNTETIGHSGESPENPDKQEIPVEEPPATIPNEN